MKKNITLLLLFVLSAFVVVSCDDEDNPLNQIINSKITASSKIDAVVAEAQADYSSDARLAAIYGRNVSLDGTIDLKDFSSLKGFVYIVQSNEKEGNEFYIPVFASDPVKSPVNFSTMLSLVNDQQTKTEMNGVFGKLSTLYIGSDVSFIDSDEVMGKFLAGGGQAFVNANSDAKVDLFLLPSKAVNVDGMSNSADWLAHFYTTDKSTVLWYRSSTETVIEF